MPQLPKHGWIHKCHFCELATARIMSITIRGKKSTASVCLRCRPTCLETLLIDYRIVRVVKDTIHHMEVEVTHEV